MAYVRNDPINFKGNTSALPNNLSIIPAGKDYEIAIVDKSTAHLVRVDELGGVKSQEHLKYRHPVTDKLVNITQVKHCLLVDKSVIVITCFDAVQICDSESHEVVYSHTLSAKQNAYTQGIVNIFNTIFVGTSFGTVLRFTISSSNDTVKVTELPQLCLDGGGDCAVYCLDMTYNVQLVCGDGSGVITVWSQPEHSTTVQTQFDCGKGYPCVSLYCYMDLAIGGYGSGHIKLINFHTGALLVEITAHAQWISALHLAPRASLLLSASEDSTCSVWHITDDYKVSLVFSTSVTNVQLCGACFQDDHGNKFILCGYEESQVFCYTKK